MAWVKIDDGFFRHPKAIRAGRDGRILFIASICYAGSNLTDGFVPEGALTFLAAETGISKPKAAAELLVDAGLWELTDGGWFVHDYLDYNTASGKVHAERDAARERMKAKRSANVRPNISRSSPEVREPETEVETETERSIEPNGSQERDTPPTPSRGKRKTPLTDLPPDFVVTDRMREWAKERHRLSDAEIDARTEHFLNYVEKTGKQYAKWDAAWRDAMGWEIRGAVKSPTPIRPPLPPGFTQDRMDQYVSLRRRDAPLPPEVIPVIDAYIAALEGRAAA